MGDLFGLSKLYELKRVERVNTNGSRKESIAEHSWSSLILADYFLNKEKNLDRLKIYELIIYHDIFQIELGDTPIHPKIEKEEQPSFNLVMEKFEDKISKTQLEKMETLALEFEFNETREAKFVNAIDKLDPMIQGITHKEKWKHWTKEFLIKIKAEFFEEFPKIKKEFYELLEELESKDYFNQ